MVLLSAFDVEGPAAPRERLAGLSRLELYYSSREPTLPRNRKFASVVTTAVGLLSLSPERADRSIFGKRQPIFPLG